MKLHQFLNQAVVNGDVGLELEIEGHVPAFTSSTYWDTKGDGSLRGGLEYVTKGALPLPKVKKALEAIHSFFDRKEARPSFSFRTSAHVHVNMHQLTEEQLIQVIYFFMLCEEVLIRSSGASRKGNRFCLSIRDSEVPVDTLVKVAHDLRAGYTAFTSLTRRFKTDSSKYSATNLASLSRFGTIEIRTMEGTMEVERLNNWCTLLVRMRDFAANFPSLVVMEEWISRRGIVAVFKEVAGDLYDYYSYDDLDVDLLLNKSLMVDVVHQLIKGYRHAPKNTSLQEGINWDEGSAIRPPLHARPPFIIRDDISDDDEDLDEEND